MEALPSVQPAVSASPAALVPAVPLVLELALASPAVPVVPSVPELASASPPVLVSLTVCVQEPELVSPARVARKVQAALWFPGWERVLELVLLREPALLPELAPVVLYPQPRAALVSRRAFL